MNTHAHRLATDFFQRDWDHLTAAERKAIERALSRSHVSYDTTAEFASHRTLGERVSDRIAAFGGSWAFILSFFALLCIWITINVVAVSRHRHAFDPYPFILLNLMLSMVAAFQA